MRRHKHSLSHFRLVTMDMAELVPVSCVEVLPGDTFQGSTSALIRVSPLVAPVMHPVDVRIHHWFVPNRLVWSGWSDFITGGPDGMGGASGPYPTITNNFVAGALGDYLGIHPGVANTVVSALPFRAYNMIWNEFYRDSDLDTARTQDDVTLAKIRWQKDYFTSARPWTQKGPVVSLPLGTTATVRTNSTELVSGAQTPAVFRKHTDGTFPTAQPARWDSATGQLRSNDQVAGTLGNYGVYPSNLYADLSTATAADVNTIRRSFAIQRYEEARARYGHRYVEYLRYLGIRPSDARLQRPEYLGGGKQTIAFSEVLQTAPTTTPAGNVGDLKGHGIAALRSRQYRRFFEEHGHVLTLMSIRPKTMYSQALHRLWSRRTKEDYYQKELETIGQQPVYRREVYLEADPNGATVFGYQDRFREYREHPSTVHGEFRSTLNFWHLSRQFTVAPALNASFVECDPSKRIHAVQTNDVLWCMIQNNIRARRMVSAFPSSRVI